MPSIYLIATSQQQQEKGEEARERSLQILLLWVVFQLFKSFFSVDICSIIIYKERDHQTIDKNKRVAIYRK